MEISEYLNAGILAVNAFVLILGFASFVYQARQNRKVQRTQIENQQIEIYQRLEMQSSGVFAFEAKNRQAVALFKSHLAPAGLPQSYSPADGTDYAEAQLTARKYYEISCNLFEVAARLRRRDIVDPEVFASWVAWFFDAATEWGFRALWHDMRDNYTPDLRDIFDEIVDELITAWDIPHMSAQPGTSLELSDTALKAIREQFYVRLAKVFDCPAIAKWMNAAALKPEHVEHPLAFR